jgi:hypothetical protein
LKGCLTKLLQTAPRCNPDFEKLQFGFILALRSANVPTIMTITDTEREIFRRMAPADKLNLVAQLHMQAREWKKAALRSQHRDWTDEQVNNRVREVFLYGTG